MDSFRTPLCILLDNQNKIERLGLYAATLFIKNVLQNVDIYCK